MKQFNQKKEIGIKTFLTNEEIENHLIDLFINTCKKSIFIYDDNIKKIKSESPDFILTNDFSSIGVEITRSLNQNLQKCFKINEQYHNGKVSICPSLFEKEIQMSRNDILKELEKSKNRIIGKAYVGNEMEKIVSNRIISSIEKKQNKFKNFKKFDKNILLIHCEMRPSLDINNVIKLIEDYLSETTFSFDFLFIKLSKYFLYFDNTQFLEYIEIV
jgi:hypothetical protein